MGCVVVASPEAFEGTRAVPGRDLLIADGARQTADRVLEAVEGRHVALRAAARRAMEDGYAWARSLAALDRVIDPLGAELRDAQGVMA
ncbi:MAG: hypothetical protein JOY70_03985 [Acidisphaera sp.]|nr:hypothetical protein [Acidisphaera sp.]